MWRLSENEGNPGNLPRKMYARSCSGSSLKAGTLKLLALLLVCLTSPCWMSASEIHNSLSKSSRQRQPKSDCLKISFTKLPRLTRQHFAGCSQTLTGRIMPSGQSRKPRTMSTSTSSPTLTRSSLNLLLSLPKSELKTWLSQFGLKKRTAIIKQMATAAGRLKRDQNIATYYPNELSHRQRVFVELDDTEAFYGGAAGGGKSDALLAAALEFVHVPRYRAIIFRRTSPRLQELIDRSREWLEGKAEFNEQKLRWSFPSGAWLHFGHMQHEADKYNFKSFEFQFIGWDELTEFLESQYTYMFSRLRSGECALHRKTPSDNCRTCIRVKALSGVPRRVRSSSNPEGEGRDWVKSRFVSDEAADAIFSGQYRDVYHNEIEKDGRRVKIPFVPSRAEDNPGIIAEDYFRESLANLAPVERARLKAGDWKIRENGVIQVAWLRYYDTQGELIRIYDAAGYVLGICREDECRRFSTIDTAGTSEDVAKDRRGKPPSWSVIATWDKLPSKFGNKIALRNIWRKRVGLTDLLAGINAVYSEWNPTTIRIEDKHFGPGIYDMLRHKMPITTIGAGSKDKLEKATDFLNMLERGDVFLPKYDNDWRNALEAEWLSWQGHPDETADQIDVASYAAMECKQNASSWGGPVSSRLRSFIGG